MIKKNKRINIVTDWILSQVEYQRLLEVDEEIKELVYKISWKGFEHLKDNSRFKNYLKTYPKNYLLDIEFYRTLTNKPWYELYSWNSFRNITLVDPDRVNVSPLATFKEGTLALDIDHITEKDLEEIKKLLIGKIELSDYLLSRARLITETLLKPEITVTTIKKYYPQLLHK